MDILSIRGLDSIYLSKSEIRIFEFAYFFYLIISMLYRLGLWLELGKLRYHTGGPGGLALG